MGYADSLNKRKSFLCFFFSFFQSIYIQDFKINSISSSILMILIKAAI